MHTWRERITGKIIRGALNFIQLQLFLTLVSLPVLIAWGLPISALSPVGNLLFAPCITAFLTLSSIIFFTQLLALPNQLFITLLEYLTTLWYTLMDSGNPDWLISFSQPSWIILLLIPVAAVLIILHKRLSQLHRTVLLTLLFAASSLYLKTCVVPPVTHCTIDYANGHLEVLYDRGKTIVIDPGFLCRSASSRSWAEYTLPAELARRLGTTTIDHFFVLKPGRFAFDALANLCHKTTVRNLYIPLWHEQLSRGALYSYGDLKRSCTACKTQLHRIGKAPLTLALSPDTALRSEPLLPAPDAAPHPYQKVMLHGVCAGQSLTISSR